MKFVKLFFLAAPIGLLLGMVSCQNVNANINEIGMESSKVQSAKYIDVVPDSLLKIHNEFDTTGLSKFNKYAK